MKAFLEAFIDKNLGDDLMIEMLVNRYPHITFYAIGPRNFNFEKPYSQWKNLLLVDHSFWTEYLDRFDAYINIGGSVWQDYGNNQMWYELRDQTVSRLHQLNKPCVMIGNNIGPLMTDAGANYFVDIMQKLDLITFRDKNSYQWAKARLPETKCKLTADVVFIRTFAQNKPNPDLIGITVHRDIVNIERNAPYVEGLSQLVKELLTRDDQLRIILFGFDSGPTQNDALCIAEILSRLSEHDRGRVTAFSYEGEIEDFIHVYSGCSYVFASHFHAVILSLMLNIPFAPYAYQNKTKDLLVDLEYEGVIYNHENFPECVSEVVEKVLRKQCDYDRAALDHMMELSALNFNLTDSFFEKITEVDKEIQVDLIYSHEELQKMTQTMLVTENNLRAQIVQIDQKIQILEDQLAEMHRQLGDARDVASEFERQLGDARDVASEFERQLGDARDVASEFERQLGDASNTITDLERQLDESQLLADEVTVNLQKVEEQLADKTQQIEALQAELSRKDLQVQEMVQAGTARRQEIINQDYQIALLHSEIASMKNSLSWKASAPLRVSKKLLKRILRRG